jgi:hypothetical protein
VGVERVGVPAGAEPVAAAPPRRGVPGASVRVLGEALAAAADLAAAISSGFRRTVTSSSVSLAASGDDAAGDEDGATPAGFFALAARGGVAVGATFFFFISSAGEMLPLSLAPVEKTFATASELRPAVEVCLEPAAVAAFAGRGIPLAAGGAPPANLRAAVEAEPAAEPDPLAVAL